MNDIDRYYQAQIDAMDEPDLYEMDKIESAKPASWDEVSMGNMINKVHYFQARDKASGYEDFDHHEWAEKANELGITEADEIEWAALKAKDVAKEF